MRIVPILAAVLIASASSSTSAAEETTIGNAITIVRTVMGVRDADVRQLKLADDVYHNEVIETKEESATELVFLDETKLALGPNSKLTLDSFVYDPDPDKSSFVATATKGVFRFVTGNLPKKAYTIHTPTATIGVRGTAFRLTVQPVIRGPGSGNSIVELVLEDGAADIVACKGQRALLVQDGAAKIIIKQYDKDCSLKVEGL